MPPSQPRTAPAFPPAALAPSAATRRQGSHAQLGEPCRCASSAQPTSTAGGLALMCRAGAGRAGRGSPVAESGRTVLRSPHTPATPSTRDTVACSPRASGQGRVHVADRQAADEPGDQQRVERVGAGHVVRLAVAWLSGWPDTADEGEPAASTWPPPPMFSDRRGCGDQVPCCDGRSRVILPAGTSVTPAGICDAAVAQRARDVDPWVVGSAAGDTVFTPVMITCNLRWQVHG